MVSVDIFVIIPEGEDVDVVSEETEIADIVMGNRFIGSTHIVFSSKGNYIGIRLLGCFPSTDNIEAALEELDAIDRYELIG